MPVGFAHGFCTLEDDTEVLYKVTTYYAAAHLGIPWPVTVADAILSDKDQRQPRLADSPGLFT